MSKIEWTGRTWNPIVGCSIVSPGCKRCYAMRAAWRMGSNPATPHYRGLTRMVNGHPVWTGEMRFHAPALDIPLRTRTPTTWFVNSMSDLFADGVEDHWLDQIFAVMALTPQHTYQVLTKRPERMRDYLAAPGLASAARLAAIKAEAKRNFATHDFPYDFWFRRNIWLGFSAEDQARFDERWAAFKHVSGFGPRFVSIEPMLSAIDLDFRRDHCDLCGGTGILARWPKGRCHECKGKGTVLINGAPDPRGYHRVDWVICGGESGPGARPMHPAWARSMRDQCAAAGVPFFFKQWGEWTFASQPGDPLHDEGFAQIQRGDIGKAPTVKAETLLAPDGSRPDPGRGHPDLYPAGTRWMLNVGKKAAGRHLDGVIHDAMPVAP